MQAITLQSAEIIRFLQAPWAVRAGYLLNILLVIWIAWLLSTATWKLVGSFESATTLPVDATDLVVDRNPYAALVSNMPGWHLMGEANLVAPTRSTAPVDAPDTRLKLTLYGVMATESAVHGRAIIGEPGGIERPYAIGDTLPGKAELSEIHADRVILFRGGRYETLRLKEDNYGGAAPKRGRSRTSSGTGQRIKKLQQQVQNNPRSLSKSLYGKVRIAPARDEKGRVIGYTLNPGKDPQLFDDIGLQPGDIAIKLNGQRLDNLTRGSKALRETINGEITLVVLRNGAEETLIVEIPE